MSDPTELHQIVVDYLYDNYYDDMERLTDTPMVSRIIAQVGKPEHIASSIDKAALFQGIKKSYPPDTGHVAAGIDNDAN